MQNYYKSVNESPTQKPNDLKESDVMHSENLITNKDDENKFIAKSEVLNEVNGNNSNKIGS